jgi:hypothetical protein
MYQNAIKRNPLCHGRAAERQSGLTAEWQSGGPNGKNFEMLP